MVATHVQIAREKQGLSQSKLAEDCGFSAQYLCDIEKRRTTPSFNVACKIAEKLYGKKYTIDEVKYLMEYNEGR